MNAMLEFFRDTSKILAALYDRTTPIDHSGLKGRDRELFIQIFLEKSFPMKYVIGTGKILDTKGKTSSQADIIIYDESMPILDYGSTKYFLDAGVLAHIEVKSYLDSRELKKALDITKSIRELEPTKSISTRSTGEEFAYIAITNRIPSCIFAYKALKELNFAKTFIKYYEGETDLSNFIDLVCALDKYSINSPQIPLTLSKTGEDSLMFFFVHLFNYISTKRMTTPNLIDYLSGIEKLKYELLTFADVVDTNTS